MARLVIFDDRVRGVDLPDHPVIIGRSKKTDIPINDGLLSRKHCAIVPWSASGGAPANGPGAASFRLVDLKSSNGTFLNGARIDRVALSVDDVIEIGHTVMVFLDTGVWNRGEALARLRNPLKAQELIQRVRMHRKDGEPIPMRAVDASGSQSDRTRQIIQSLPFLRIGAEGAPGGGIPEDLLERLVDYSLYKTVALWVRHHPRIRRAVVRAVESTLLASASEPGEDLRSRLRGEIRRQLEAALAAEEAPGAAPETPSQAAGADGDGSPPAEPAPAAAENGPATPPREIGEPGGGEGPSGGDRPGGGSGR